MSAYWQIYASVALEDFPASVTRQTLGSKLRLVRCFMRRCGPGLLNGRVTTLLRLTYLAPDIIRDILDGHQPPSLTRQKLLEKSRGLPHDWAEQRVWLGWET